MNTAAIQTLPKVQNALSKSLSKLISDSVSSKRHKSSILNYYSSFVYVIGHENYTGMDILNDAYKLSKHLHQFLGFIYSVLPIEGLYNTARQALNAFTSIAEDKQLSIDIPKIYNIPTSVTQEYISKFNALKPCRKRLNYLNGWQVTSKEGQTYNFTIGQFHETFGDVITSKIYEAVCNYGLTLKSKTLDGKLKYLSYLLNAFTQHSDSKKDLETQLDAMNSHHFFERVMWSMFTRTNRIGNKPKRFFIDWSSMVTAFTQCFIDSEIFDEPISPFLTPNFKEDSQPIAKASIGGKLTASEEKLWLANIPLHIKDEEVIQIIEDRLRVSEEHVRSVFHKQFLAIKERHERNQVFIKTGRIKTTTNKGLSMSERVPMGKANLANVIATFHHYGINGISSKYSYFLRSYGENKLKSDELQTELNLPTTDTLGALCTLLVLEHPALTPSALESWELYDAQDQQVGYKRSGHNNVIVVCKDRKGADNAQQVIILNEYSQEIVETMIAHTAFAREYLKANPSSEPNRQNEWRKMLIKAAYHKAEWEDRFGKNMTNKTSTSFFRRWVADYSHSELSNSDKSLLSEVVSLRSARRLRAIRIYIETRSLRAVSEALGHKMVDMAILSRYLPESLMTFFNARWIRQFQNALIYQAMENSEYLFEAIDISPEYLDEFLKNHRINDIPALFDKFKTTSEHTLATSEDTEQPEFDEVTFTVTETLLRVLIAIKSVVDESKQKNDKQTFKDIVSTWYEAATLLLTDLDLDSRQNYERKALLESAKGNPLDPEHIRGALLC
ncbi:hypothetical protein [Vibrio parahaemolyticus]|uniref:hypothetical protein n=1 Tax=Vibrio parahaemolyticus TaxID=670 RepID=UPI00084BADAA|nr:hypothetical protein [Vibrio parahaemolyticus]MCZ6362706.1 hypothetical protein [Vibrio parahaemolyticus]MCZ6367219.1 hypothetical protein [Vibrio parahaemolyticus]ODZ45718.1 hypothetical protein BBM41_18100 [Vibrio parahaemolyticus]ODZ64699.1 hypothetical protein BBM42_11275 [Vibrio parahaemolyticus]HCE3245590.1 hypothetical protein [Vibrio parahaemolyticus]